MSKIDLSRRGFLGTSLALGCSAAASPLITPVTFAAAPGDTRLVVIVLRGAMDGLLTAADELGSPLHDPFMAMSFMALEVIPSLKLTDVGLVDVEAFNVVELFVDG